MFVCDLDDIRYGEPALLTVRQAGSFVQAYSGGREKKKKRGEEGEESGERTNKGRGRYWRFLRRSCKKVKANKLLKRGLEDGGI